ncbi:MAG: glycosyltransferase [Bryobacteraceae bacterium]
MSPLRVVVLMPLRDDWAAAAELIRRIDQAVAAFPSIVQVLLVDDASVQPCPTKILQSQFQVVRGIRVLPLRRNLGHQRAIALGLVHVQQSMPCDAVLVMDADGEDTPEGVLQLLQLFSGTTATFAARSRRTESLLFISFYNLYKILYLVLTGNSVRVGNFSILPARYLDTLVVMSELWNHYAAAVFRSGLPYTMTPIPRGYRLHGSSRMNFVSLTVHGISAISVFGDIAGVRVLIASLVGAGLTILAILAVVGIRSFTDLAIPGWASYAVGLLVIILLQLMTMAASFTFTMLSNRINLNFVPLRDHQMFVGEPRDIRLDEQNKNE